MDYNERHDREIRRELLDRYLENIIIRDKGTGYYGSRLYKKEKPPDLKKIDEIVDRACMRFKNGKR